MAGSLGSMFGGGGGGLGGMLGGLLGGGGGGNSGPASGLGIYGTILNAINGMTGGKIFGSTSVPFVPQGLEGVADKNWQQMFGDLWDQMQKSNPQLAQQLQGAFSGAQGAQPGIQQAYGNLAGMTPGLMQQLLGQAGQEGQGMQQLMGAGNQLWQTAQDPQNELRNRMQQQVQDTSRTASSARGIGMGPQAAGLENQAMSNFNMDWQNQQLGRQAQGLGGMQQAFGQAANLGRGVGQDITGGLGVGQMGPQFMQASAQYPFDVANMFGSGMNQNLYGPLLQAMMGGQNYMNTGVPATANSFAAGQTGLRNITNLGGQLGQIFGQGQGQGPGYQTDPYAQQGYGT